MKTWRDPESSLTPDFWASKFDPQRLEKPRWEFSLPKLLCPWTSCCVSILVGGWFSRPSQKHAQIKMGENLPQSLGWKFQKYLKPPPRIVLAQVEHFCLVIPSFQKKSFLRMEHFATWRCGCLAHTSKKHPLKKLGSAVHLFLLQSWVSNVTKTFFCWT